MTNKVRVTADAMGNLIGVSQNNPEYGYIRVEQAVTQINANGWLTNVRRSALIKGKVVDLVNAGFTEGQELDGRIIVKESFFPFNPENPDRDLKMAGESGVICRVNDQPIYRQTFYTADEKAIDELIMHTNTEEIKDAMAATRALGKLTVNRSEQAVLG